MKKIIFLATLPLLLLTSCGATGQRIEEDLTTVNIIDDKYRNYYEIFVGSFYDSNRDGMGDLDGVTMKLDYIKETGYNGIWLMPIFTSPTYHKYNATNYYEIDPKYGTMEDLQELIDACHSKGIKLIIDLVLNHCSKQSSLFQDFKSAFIKSVWGEALTEEEENFKDLFSVSETANIGWNYLTNQNGKTYYYECHFDGDMPEFNFDSEFTRSYFKNVIKYYLDMGIDGFRLDAVKYFYKDVTSKNCELLDYFYHYSQSMNPDVYFVGECWDDGLIKSYYRDTDVDSFFHFPMHGTNGGYVRSLNLEGAMQELYLGGLKQLVEYAGENVPAPFLDNHDTSRMAKKNLESSKMSYGLFAMSNGSIFTYYGDEIAMTGAVKPDENVRTFFPWEEGGVGICENPANTAKCEYAHGYLSEQLENPNSMYYYAKKAMFLRNQHPAIARGKILESSTCFDDWDNSTYHYTLINKEYNGEQIGILINFHDTRSVTVNIAEHGYTTVNGQLVVNVDNPILKLNESKLIIPPYGIAILK